MIKIGCHLSSSGGYMAMARTALSIDANTFQYFTRNPRGGAAKALDRDDCAAFNEFSKAEGIFAPLAHAPYTLNACAAKENVRVFAKETMADDLMRLQYIDGAMYNFHPGSHVGQGVEEGIRLISELLNEVLLPDHKTLVPLETMAGKGSEVGSRFEELAEIIDRVELSDKLGVCLDTCHVYDAGYDILNDLDGVLNEFDSTIGLSRLKAVHINDSKNPFMSHKDRHEKIGEGSLGLEFFEKLVNHPVLRDKPFYLETPNELDGYANEIRMLKGAFKE